MVEKLCSEMLSSTINSDMIYLLIRWDTINYSFYNNFIPTYACGKHSRDLRGVNSFNKIKISPSSDWGGRRAVPTTS